MAKSTDSKGKKAGCSTGCLTIFIILAILGRCSKSDSKEKSPDTNVKEQSYTATQTITTEATTTVSVPKPTDLITKDTPACFTEFEPLDCDGVEFSVNKLKVSPDLGPHSQYNFYYVIIDYSVKNNREDDINWKIHRTGNIYGDFYYDEYVRYLGGNRNIKDNDIEAPWNNQGMLKNGESDHYRLTLVIDRELDDPKEGLLLKYGSEMSIKLPLYINDVKWDIDIDLNKDEQ